MKDDRLRVPVDTPCLAAIGIAAYCFAQMEWNAVYCGDKLEPGFVHIVGTKTAGMIAKDIVGLTRRITDPTKQARYRAAADEFERLVRRRNDLMQANPTTIASDQRLVRHGTPWQTERYRRPR